MNKDEIREIISQKRSGLDDVWVEDMSCVILDRLAGLEEYSEADKVSCYMGTESEVRTAGIIDRCLADGKKVCVPAFDDALGKYRMAFIESCTTMSAGKMGIEEPAQPLWAEINDIDLFLVPGLAFDIKGGRVGYGRGCYDDMMNGTDAFKAALAFDFQVFDSVPVEEHDVLLDMIITETKTITAG